MAEDMSILKIEKTQTQTKEERDREDQKFNEHNDQVYLAQRLKKARQ